MALTGTTPTPPSQTDRTGSAADAASTTYGPASICHLTRTNRPAPTARRPGTTWAIWPRPRAASSPPTRPIPH